VLDRTMMGFNRRGKSIEIGAECPMSAFFVFARKTAIAVYIGIQNRRQLVL